MLDQELLDVFTAFTPFLSALLGAGCEVVVHDLKNPKHSIVAIENSLSGRKVGDPMTNLPLECARDASFIANYSGSGKGKQFLSSSYFIKNEGRIIGILCVNKDVEIISDVKQQLHLLLERFNLMLPAETGVQENLDHTVEDILKSRIEEAVLQVGISPARMRMQEKMEVTQTLQEQGVLSMRGAVAELAEKLNVSVPTIYRYMAKK